jgi:Uma2 family endonuclease
MSVTAEKFRWTVDRYHQAVAAGMLLPDDRYELIEGELITVVPPKPPHTAIVKRLHRFLLLNLDGNAYDVSSQQPVNLAPDSHPEPDVMVAQGPPSRFDDRHPTPADMLLVVEVADTSLQYDREIKVPLYARYAIPEVWVVDVADRAIDVYREPSQASYTKVSHHTDGPLAASQFPDVMLDVSRLFA